MTNFCAYRPFMGGFEQRCLKSCCHQKKYCMKHSKKQNYILEIIDSSWGTAKKSSSEYIYDLVHYIYNHDTYDIDSNSTLDNSTSNKCKLFCSAMNYLFSRDRLDNILQSMKCSKVLRSKNRKIMEIHDILYNTMKSGYQESYVVKIQRFARKYINRVITKYQSRAPSNEEDPFTLEKIENIPLSNIFSYIDENGRIFAFNAIELDYYIRYHNKMNPYTRINFDQITITRLGLFMKYNNLVPKKHNDYSWHTPLQAYTDVSHALEKAGFYNDVKWLSQLSYYDCVNIIQVFLDMSQDVPNADQFFQHDFDLNPSTYQYDFSSELMKLFANADEHYLLCCYIVKAMSLYSAGFRNSMPNWLSGIDFPPNTVDYNSMFVIYYIYSDFINSVR